MFLTDEALAQLTGLQRPSAMCRWLEREGIPFVVANVSGVLAAILPPSRCYLLQTP